MSVYLSPGAVIRQIDGDHFGKQRKLLMILIDDLKEAGRKEEAKELEGLQNLLDDISDTADREFGIEANMPIESELLADLYQERKNTPLIRSRSALEMLLSDESVRKEVVSFLEREKKSDEGYYSAKTKHLLEDILRRFGGSASGVEIGSMPQEFCEKKPLRDGKGEEILIRIDRSGKLQLLNENGTPISTTLLDIYENTARVQVVDHRRSGTEAVVDHVISEDVREEVSNQKDLHV